MDYRILSRVPESFYAETKKLFDHDQMDFFAQPHPFEHEGTEYTVSMSRNNLEVMIRQLHHNSE